MATMYDDYAKKFETIKFKREEGILEMTIDTNNDSLRWGPTAQCPSLPSSSGASSARKRGALP